MDGTKAGTRKDQFKAAVTADDARRKREDQTIQIRKSKKEERLQKRRFNASNRKPEPSTGADEAKPDVRDI